MKYFEIIEATDALRRPKQPSGTKPPLTPEQVRRAAEHKNTVQRQMRDENQRHSIKLDDLRDKLIQGS